MTQGTRPPGWYKDPHGKTSFWDGTRWGVPPLPGAAPSAVPLRRPAAPAAPPVRPANGRAPASTRTTPSARTRPIDRAAAARGGRAVPRPPRIWYANPTFWAVLAMLVLGVSLGVLLTAV